MSFTQDGEQVNIYDYVAAHTIESGDQIAHSSDLIEVKSIIDSGESVMIHGYSHIAGDSVSYILPADLEVGLWTV